MAGVPAASVPMGVDASGRPVAAQLVAGPGGEPQRLDTARLVEQVAPWQRTAATV